MTAAPLALITGIDGSLGAAIRTALDGEYRVVGFSHAGTGDPAVIACDLRDAAQIAQAFSTVEARFGVPSCLINCAGIYGAQAWGAISVQAFDDEYAVNLRAPFILSRLAARAMEGAGIRGAIINIASVSGQIGSVDPAYAATKAGLLMLTKVMARGLAPMNIRVCAVAPGPVDNTAMGDRIPEESKNTYYSRIPMQRFAKPHEVAGAVKFLLGADASYITGSVINVDGGLV